MTSSNVMFALKRAYATSSIHSFAMSKAPAISAAEFVQIVEG